MEMRAREVVTGGIRRPRGSNVSRKPQLPLTLVVIAVTGPWTLVANLAGTPHWPTALVCSVLNTWLLYRYGEV